MTDTEAMDALVIAAKGQPRELAANAECLWCASPVVCHDCYAHEDGDPRFIPSAPSPKGASDG